MEVVHLFALNLHWDYDYINNNTCSSVLDYFLLKEFELFIAHPVQVDAQTLSQAWFEFPTFKEALEQSLFFPGCRMMVNLYCTGFALFQ